jgi:hypothetical protein
MPGPVQIAQELLEYICRLPNAALEAHGPAIELKVFEIASAVADSFITHLSYFSCPTLPTPVLNQLQQILATSRGGNSSLLGLLAAKIAQLGHMASLPLPPLPGGYDLEGGFDMIRNTHVVEELMIENGDQGQDWDEQSPAARMSSPSSPWLSLVAAAAEMEHQQDQGTGPFPGGMSAAELVGGRAQARLDNGVMAWFGLS